ncbi:hypothetical protein AKJ09_07686 [Labilithrix luteola]|uniref:Haem-binding uptake Tiki superfamily ChaN domain-containing protein n=1 Tax=Labilithrix luteola TaxID=1391654 RepID=A0A0K1Q5K9_9BACT|nr:hypothetical protein [Labilithrix luteola]AKV01023.1 hypothetical protein AKJ09_07686 [Labilithrix luteola]
MKNDMLRGTTLGCLTSLALLACGRNTAPSADLPKAAVDASPVVAPEATADAAAAWSPPLPPGAATCAVDGDAGAAGLSCFEFVSASDAFRWVLGYDPAIVAIGEAHAQKGTEEVASATKRFTDAMLPALEGRASDLLVEAWAGDPRCQKEVKQVASAQAPVRQAQAESNPNEYVALGTRAKAIGIQPHLLRPSCDDYAGLADAGADVISASLDLIKRLTQADVTALYKRNLAGDGKLVVTYGGAMHNDLSPSEKLEGYSFGPELFTLSGGRYVELDLIPPEYVKETDVWQKLPWFSAWQARKASPATRDKVTLYRLAAPLGGKDCRRTGCAPTDHAFVLVFAGASAGEDKQGRSKK